MMLKDEGQKILNLKRVTLQKKKIKPANTNLQNLRSN
jgi:hypothetical protein